MLNEYAAATGMGEQVSAFAGKNCRENKSEKKRAKEFFNVFFGIVLGPDRGIKTVCQTEILSSCFWKLIASRTVW
jgi:hypothetical protein